MRNKLTLLFLLVWGYAFPQLVKVPDTNTFPFSDTYNSVYSHNQSVQRSLSSVFSYSVDGFYNALYKGNKDRLSNLKDYDPNRFAIQLSDATYASSRLYVSGDVFNASHFTSNSRGVVWSTSPYPVVSSSTYKAFDPFYSGTNATGYFEFDFAGTGANPLTNGVTYYIRAFTQSPDGTYNYSNQLMFTVPGTTPSDPPTDPGVPVPDVLTEYYVSDMTANSVKVKGYFRNYPTISPYLVEYGVCFKLGSGNPPTVSDYKVTSSNYVSFTTGLNYFTSTLSGLQEFQEYTARAYVTTTGGTTYGGLVKYKNGVITTVTQKAVNFRPSNYYIGRYVNGGYVAMISTSRDNWQVGYLLSPSIVNVSGTTKFNYNTAVQVCEDAAINGFTDWHLPMITQPILDLKASHPDIFTNLPNDQYWTDLYYSTGMHITLYFPTGIAIQSQNLNLHYALPIRIF